MTENVMTEIKAFSMLDHPNVCHMYEVIENPLRYYVVMELAGEELFDYIVERGRLDEHEGKRFFRQLIEGLDHCHRRRVAHRDLKPENILVTPDGDIKIADFGLSAVMKDGEYLTKACGSLNYAAPRVISGKPYSGPEVDVWSAGCVLFTMLCGRLPFDEESIPRLQSNIKKGLYAIPNHLSKGAKDLIKRMLTVDPAKRISINTIRLHPWLKGTDSAVFPPAASTFDSQAIRACALKGISKMDVEIGIRCGAQLLTMPAFGNRQKLRSAVVMYNIIRDGERLHRRRIHKTKTSLLASRGALPASTVRALTARNAPESTIPATTTPATPVTPATTTPATPNVVAPVWMSIKNLDKKELARVRNFVTQAARHYGGADKPQVFEDVAAKFQVSLALARKLVQWTIKELASVAPRPLEMKASRNDAAVERAGNQQQWTVGHAACVNPDLLLKRITSTLRRQGWLWRRDSFHSLSIKKKEDDNVSHSSTEGVGAKVRIRRISSKVVLDFQKVFGEAAQFLQLCSMLVLAVQS
uniref:Protein kinase domain-containing protein n=1 Tax=Lotharella oceanica TaxID=641309 RepID=A0A7S2TF35_9EUKA